MGHGMLAERALAPIIPSEVTSFLSRSRKGGVGVCWQKWPWYPSPLQGTVLSMQTHD